MQLNDPQILVLVVIVGTYANVVGAAVALYLWTQQRSDRYLLFWGLTWVVGAVRHIVHVPADSLHWLRVVETGVLLPIMFIFNSLGSYDLLPTKPWKSRYVVASTASIMFTYGAVANVAGRPIVMSYGLAVLVYFFGFACLWRAYRGTGLSGHAFAAATFLAWSVWFLIGLFAFGKHVSRTIVGPLFNIPLAVSLVIIAYQRRGRQLAENERALRASADEMQALYVRLANVEDDERRALHSELHDQVGANLAALRLELDVAASLLTRDDGANTQRHLASARDVAMETIAMARDLMAQLRPPALDDYGLVAALRTFAASQSARLTLPIHVTGIDLLPRPSRLVEGALFRIAQESVINAARHASASSVAIEVAACDGRVRLTITDDGVGFDPAAPISGPDHWGLKNMRERARAVGGVLCVDSAPGVGTRVTAEAPGEAS